MTPSPDSPAPAAYVPPVAAADRMLAPDLLRGIALLGIALANSVYFIADRPLGPLARPTDGTSARPRGRRPRGHARRQPRVPPVHDAVRVRVHRDPPPSGRRRGRRAARPAAAPPPEPRADAVRRAARHPAVRGRHPPVGYGILGLALAAMYRAPDRAYRALAWSTAIVFLLVAGTDGLTADAGTGSVLAVGDDDTFLGDLAGRAVTLGVVLVGTPVLVGALVPLAAIGVLLGRRGVLEDPVGNLPFLRRLALVGMPVSVLGALPLVVVTVGAVDADPVALYLLGVLHGATGVAGALGLLGIVGWAVAMRAHRGDPAPGPVLRALIAVGRRSMTCYLLQSLLFAILLEPWSLGLGVGAGTARIALIAVAVWLVTVAVAVALERRGIAGPAERAIRRLAYGRPPTRPTTAGPGAPGEPVSAG
ncbi:DUF418 domain-containing protein [Clavibacter zhangzhiyongii]|uniref:DUF418 domain-containing protein n=1 Tax=Clavibacter zhangzhiyongii TaxID=2768071 RepID=UPI0039E09A5D